MAARCIRIGRILSKSQNWVEPKPDETYKQITARLWGKGLALRGEVSGSQIAATRQLEAKAGQFLISRIDARNGAFGIVPPSLDGALVSNDFPCFDIDAEKALPDYVGWYARTDRFIGLCRRASEGSTNRVRLKESRFLAMFINLPSPDQQRHVVSRLNNIAALVAEASVLRETIDRDAFSVIQNVHLGRSDYSKRPFGEFIEPWEDRVSVEPTRHYPQIGLRAFARGLFFKDSIEGSETTYRTFTRLHDGLFIVSQPKGWEGAVAVCDGSHEGWYASPEYRTFRCKPGCLDAQYLAALLPTPWFQRELTKLTRGQGARRERLRPEMLLNMRIRMPAIRRQYDILSQLEGLHHLRDLGAGARNGVGSIIPSLLNRLFSEANIRHSL